MFYSFILIVMIGYKRKLLVYLHLVIPSKNEPSRFVIALNVMTKHHDLPLYFKLMIISSLKSILSFVIIIMTVVQYTPGISAESPTNLETYMSPSSYLEKKYFFQYWPTGIQRTHCNNFRLCRFFKMSIKRSNIE